MSSVDMAYSTATLRQGGRQALGAGQTAGAAADILDGTICPPAAIGAVTGAEALSVALARAAAVHTALARRVHADHVDLDVRAGSTADAGDAATADTAATARTGAGR